MRKNIFLILLVAAIFVFVGAMNNNARAEDDPVDFIKNAKTPVILHSLAPGDQLIEWPDIINSEWHSLYPPNTYCHEWRCDSAIGDAPLSKSDKLRIRHKITDNWVWVQVESVTVTVKIKKLTYPHPDSLDPDPDSLTLRYLEYWGTEPLTWPTPAWLNDVICTYWHEVWPIWCRYWHIHSWINTGDETLDSCDIIDIIPIEFWHVIDQEGDPGGPLTLTLEGLGDQAGGTMVLTHFDSTGTTLDDPVCTFWHEEHPDTCKWWHIHSWHEGDGIPNHLDSCDTIDIEPIEIWHVQSVAGDTVTIDSVNYDEITPPKVLTFTAAEIESCTYLHEVSPDWCTWWHVIKVIDRNGGGVGHCDIIIVKKIEFWHVRDVAKDIEVLSIPDPTVPTMTQWGLIVLVALIVASAIYVMVRRRRATVPT